MNYQKIHDSIIKRAQNRVIGSYTERHHIIPKCMGGTDDLKNLVNLTAREHFIVHWLLTFIYPNENGLKFAFWNMCQRGHSSHNRHIPSSRTYEWARQQLKGIPKPIGFQIGEKNTFYGKKHTQETLNKISESLKGREFSEKHRHKLSEAAKKRKGNKPSKFKGMKYEDYLHPDDIIKIKENIREKLIGKRLSDTHRKNISNSLKGNKLGPMSNDHKEALKKSFKQRDHKRKEEANQKWISLLEDEIKNGVAEHNYDLVKKYYKKVKYRGLNIDKYNHLLPIFNEIETRRRKTAQQNRNK